MEFQSQDSVIGVVGDTVHIGGDLNITLKQNEKSRDENEESRMRRNIDKFHLPRLNDQFYGRDLELTALEHNFVSQKKNKVSIYGIPGIGKTELAKQFGNILMEKQIIQKLFWIEAERKEDIIKAFKELAKSCNMQEQDEKTLVKEVYEKFKEYKCLFIFDNASNRRSILDYLEPPDEFLLLITSYKKDWGQDVSSLKLDELSRYSAVKVLQTLLNENSTEENVRAYEKLADSVGNIPLGLQIIAAYIKHEKQKHGIKFKIDNYVKKLNQTQKEIIDLKFPGGIKNSYNKSLYRAIEISIHKIYTDNDYKVGKLALDILYTCAYINAEEITLEILSNIYKLLDKESDKLLSALVLLDNFAFIAFNPETNKIIMHRFIQLILREKCRLSKYYLYYYACLDYLFMNNYQVEHTSVTLSYADENINTVYKFYKNHESKRSKDKDSVNCQKIMVSLVQNGCFECVKKIFNNIGKDAKKYINKLNLVYEAAYYDHLHILEFLLKYNIDVNVLNKNMDTPLHAAAFNWNKDAINLLLNYYPNRNKRNSDGNIALFSFFNGAYFHNQINFNEVHVNEILSLLDIKNNLKTTNAFGETILHLATSSFQANLVYLLVSEYNMNVNEQDLKLRTPFHTLMYQSTKAYRERITETAKILLKSKASLNIPDIAKRTPLQTLIYRNLDYLLISLCNSPIILDSINTYNLLHYTVLQNQITILHILLEYINVNINKQDDNNDTPLHVACFRKNIDAIRILISKKANVNIKNRLRNIPLYEYFKDIHNYKTKDVKTVLKLFNLNENNNIKNKNGQTLLHVAVELLNVKLVELLIFEYKLNINEQDYKLRSALHILTSLSSSDNPLIISIAKILLKSGALIFTKDKNNKTPFDIALDNELYNILDLFFSHCELDVFMKYINVNTLLHKYAHLNKCSVLKYLLQKNVDINYKDELFNTCLHFAAFKWNFDTIIFLVQNNIDLNARNCIGNIALFTFFEGAYNRTHINMSQVNKVLSLLHFEKYKNTRNNYGHSVLHIAAESFKKNMVQLLLTKHKMDVNIQDFKKRTPLYNLISRAAENYDTNNIIATANFLMEHNASIDIENTDNTVLDYALNTGLKYLYELLLESVNKFALLQIAVKEQNIQLLKKLLRHNIDVNKKDQKKNNTALHIASYHWNLEIIQILLKNDADLNARNEDGETSLFSFFRGASNQKIVNIDKAIKILDLLNLQANINIRNNSGESLLHMAIESCRDSLVQLLISKYNMDVNAKDYFGCTPLHLCVYISLSSFSEDRGVIGIINILKNHNVQLNNEDLNYNTPYLLAKKHNLLYLLPYLK